MYTFLLWNLYILYLFVVKSNLSNWNDALVTAWQGETSKVLFVSFFKLSLNITNLYIAHYI